MGDDDGDKDQAEFAAQRTDKGMGDFWWFRKHMVSCNLL